MGMYTEFVLSVWLVENVSQEVVDVLKYMTSDEATEDAPTTPDHPFFSVEGWQNILTSGSFSFPGSLCSQVAWNETSQHWELEVRSHFRNYHDEISMFLDWLTPHVKGNGFAGYSRFEANAAPDLIFFSDGEYSGAGIESLEISRLAFGYDDE